MKIRLAAPLQTYSTADGEGFRMVIWNQGCRLHCPGCHNQQTWDETSGQWMDTQEIISQITQFKDTHEGITLSGGDPFLQPEANAEIAIAAHELGLNVWAYCGQTFEELIQEPSKLKLLQECDVLVDGPFILAQRDLTLPFRGSRNQKVINVQESLKNNEIIEIEY